MQTIRLRLTRDQAKAILRQLPGVLTGTRPDPTSLVAPLLRAVGVEALSIIKQEFVVKSRGGTDAAGISWPPLSKAYVAYGRRHPGVLFPGHLRAPFSPSWMLTSPQRKRWWALYRQFGGGAPQGAAYHAKNANRGWAAMHAWRVLKNEGAKTLIGEYGDAKVEIGRDTGRLFNSLGPVENGSQDVVLAVEKGGVRVGTNVVYSGWFHKKRPMWPSGDWPAAWTGRLEDTLADGLGLLAQLLLQRAAGRGGGSAA